MPPRITAIKVSLSPQEWNIIIDLVMRGADECDCFDDPAVKSLQDQVNNASNPTLNTST